MDKETFEFEDRVYVDPQISLNEQNDFIDKFRNLQTSNQAEINQQTQSLGSDVPSNQGGLIGAEGTWNVQYQRPQVNAAIENLRKANQLQALNTVMANEQSAMANRLAQAKRAYQQAQQERYKKDRDKANQLSSQRSNQTKGTVTPEYLASGSVNSSDQTIRSNAPGTATVLDPNRAIWDTINQTPNANVYDLVTGQLLYQDTRVPTSTSQNNSSVWGSIIEPILTGVNAAIPGFGTLNLQKGN